VPSDANDYYETGLQTLVEIGWKRDTNDVIPTNPDIDQAFWNHTLENLWGRIWARPDLSLRERQMIVLAILTATGSEIGIEFHLKNCHNLGITEQEVRELLMLTGYYAGWPKFASTTVQFNRYLAQPESTWPAEKRMQLPERGERPDLASENGDDWYDKGLQTLVDLGWTQELTNVHPFNPDVDQAFWNHTIENLWGRIYARPGLTIRERQIIVLSVLIYQDSDLGIYGHFKNCHAVGLTEAEVREIIMQAGYYCGWPKFAAATIRFNRVLKDPESTWPESARMELPERGERPASVNGDTRVGSSAD
jgi:4-carboxymuconolactone decarboxylase